MIESFHAESERGVHQEPYAAFALVTAARLFASRCDHDISHDIPEVTACRPCAPASGTG